MQKLIDVLIRSRIVLIANLNDLSRFLPESQQLYDMTNSQIQELETVINDATAEQRFASSETQGGCHENGSQRR